MLTRKQLWRRTSTSHLSNNCKFSENETDFEAENSIGVPDNIDITGPQNNKKLLTFSPEVRVYLIPSREDLNKILGDIYWDIEELRKFRLEAFADIRKYAIQNEVTMKEAMTVLYQPEYDVDNHHERLETTGIDMYAQGRRKSNDIGPSETRRTIN